MHDKIRGKVKQYPYRTARVRDIYLKVPRDTVKPLEEQLAEAASTSIDNHTVYEIVQPGSDSTVYIMFSDFEAVFGHFLCEERW